HGVMNFLIKFIRENHGEKHLEAFFTYAAAYIYKPLIERIRKNGLTEMKQHIEKVFSMEGGKVVFKIEDNYLVCNIKKCPAIYFMKDHKMEIDKNFCKSSTEIVNRSIAKESGYSFKVDYDQEKGSCIQKFWKENK
ncbi:MAG: hypothetical protein M1308_18000, partial [Actinobacteria bacterium]|nr:hypothetical protein [Actinomycetota bacterium]